MWANNLLKFNTYIFLCTRREWWKFGERRDRSISTKREIDIWGIRIRVKRLWFEAVKSRPRHLGESANRRGVGHVPSNSENSRQVGQMFQRRRTVEQICCRNTILGIKRNDARRGSGTLSVVLYIFTRFYFTSFSPRQSGAVSRALWKSHPRPSSHPFSPPSVRRSSNLRGN